MTDTKKHNGRNWHQKHQESMGVGDKIADVITKFVGSWSFIFIHIVWFAIWIIVPIEPFPYGLLTMIVSLEAILLSTFIMLSQNRSADRDRHQAEADYETNRTAKEEIEKLQENLARIENDKLDKILTMMGEK